MKPHPTAENLSSTTHPTIEKGWKQVVSAGFIAAISLSAAQPAAAGAVFNFSEITSTTSFNAGTGNYDYSYTFGYSLGFDAYVGSVTIAIPVFDLGAITNITAPAGWNGSVSASTGIWNAIYNPLADPKAGTYAAADSAFAAGQVPYVLEFTSFSANAPSGSISGFSFSSPYAPTAAPFVARFVTEGSGTFDLIGDPDVPASPNFPIPEPASSALLVAAGAMFAARRRRP